MELIANSGVYIKVSDLKAIEQTPKESPTALMRSFISIWYSGRLLASCSATKGINPDIKNAVFGEPMQCYYMYIMPYIIICFVCAYVHTYVCRYTYIYVGMCPLHPLGEIQQPIHVCGVCACGCAMCLCVCVCPCVQCIEYPKQQV